MKSEILSSSPILAETKDSKESSVDREETVSSESETTSSWRIKSPSSVSDVSGPSAPKSSLFTADFAASTNHSSSGRALTTKTNFGIRLENRDQLNKQTETGKLNLPSQK